MATLSQTCTHHYDNIRRALSSGNRSKQYRISHKVSTEITRYPYIRSLRAGQSSTQTSLFPFIVAVSTPSNRLVIPHLMLLDTGRGNQTYSCPDPPSSPFLIQCNPKRQTNVALKVLIFSPLVFARPLSSCLPSTTPFTRCNAT